MNREKTRVPRVRGKLAEVTAGRGGGFALSQLNNGREGALYAHVRPAQSPWVPWEQVLGAPLVLWNCATPNVVVHCDTHRRTGRSSRPVEDWELSCGAGTPLLTSRA